MSRQGTNDFDDVGHGGPCPPEGESHRYAFHLLPLHAQLVPEAGADRESFDEAIRGHVIAEARLEGGGLPAALIGPPRAWSQDAGKLAA